MFNLAIPPSALLNERTSGASEVLCSAASLTATDRLILALLHERHLGSKSAFSCYVDLLPAQPPVPLFWQNEERELLQGTGVPADASEVNAIRHHYESIVLPWLKQHRGQFPTTSAGERNGLSTPNVTLRVSLAPL